MIDTVKDFKIFFHNFIESLPYGVMIINQEGCIEDLNRNIAFMFNIDCSPSRVVRYGDVLDDKLKLFFDQLIGDIRTLGLVRERQFSVPVAGETEVVLALSGSIITDPVDQTGRIAVLCREMTARQELDRMRELEKLKSDFISSITHDLKTPLTSIVGYSDLLLEISRDRLNAEEIDFLNIIQQEGMRLTGMVNDILNVAKIESGKVQLKPELLSLKDIIDEVMKVVAVQKNRFNFVAEIDEKIPSLWLDRELMTRVFMNLVSNAIKYSPSGGEIRVEGIIKEHNACVNVKDQGMGMSEESLAHLFEKFFRVKSDSMKGIGGTGLGLVITRGIVEAHGGIMTVASELGKGSTFSVILPLSLASRKPE